ncbi:MAG: pilus assembly protein TadG-related protein [Candidatus Rifleibacteriota bacterium]
MFIKFLNLRRGSVLLMTALASVFLISMTGLVTDVGYMYYSQSKLQTATNAGWKAGYDRMMMMKSDDGALDEDEKSQIISHIEEVMRKNGFTAEQLENLEVIFGANNRLEIRARVDVGLFFARIMNFNTANVSAGRKNHEEDIGQGVVPFAIPHGVTKDLSKNTYICELFADDLANDVPGVTGFRPDTEYVLKLGSGGKKDPDAVEPVVYDPGKIFIPMDESQTNEGLTAAYGAIYWCLKMDSNDQGFVPVEWLLGYRGGSFLVPNHADVKSILKSYSVNYEEIIDEAVLDEIYGVTGHTIKELYDRPSIAVYSTSQQETPLEMVLTEAKIPFGPYSLPGNWTRSSKFSDKNSSTFSDSEILNGNLDQYQVVLSTDEDLTGMSYGCEFWLYTCRDFLENGYLGKLNNEGSRIAAAEHFCPYCRDYYNTKNDKWSPTYAPNPDDDTHNCQNVRRRCVDKMDYLGNRWAENSNITICGDESKQCKHDELLRTIADNHGFTSDAGSEPKPQYAVYSDGSRALPNDLAGWFDKAGKVQKMKWQIAANLKDHVGNGGILFAQSFTAETLDLALYQAAIYDGWSATNAYENCLAFEDFSYVTFPRFTNNELFYSNINTIDGQHPFNLLEPLEPACQNHNLDYACFSDNGLTNSFVVDKTKSNVIILGYQMNKVPDWAKYLMGNHKTGKYLMMGGSAYENQSTARLPLNSILMGALTDKVEVSLGTTTISGKQKSNYGPIDPDNNVAGGANDYRDRIIYGFNQPMELGDRVITESGNMRGPTDQGVDARLEGTSDLAPSKIVVVPITDVPPEVAANNPHNADAMTIYDLQGNDHPDGIYDPDLYDFGSAVRITGFAVFEILGPDEYNRIGENYDLGDSGDLGSYQPGQVRGKFIRYIVKPGEVPVD